MEGNKNVLQEKYEGFSKITKYSLILATVLLNCIVTISFLQLNRFILKYDISVVNSTSLALNFREEHYTIYNNETLMLCYIVCVVLAIIFVFVSIYMEYVNCLSGVRGLAYVRGMQCFSIFEKRIKKDTIRMYKIVSAIFVISILGFLLLSYKLNTVPATRGTSKDIKVEDVFNEKTVVDKDGVVKEVLEIPMSKFSDVLQKGSKVEKLDNLSILGKDYKYSHSGNGYYYFSLR